MISVLAIGPKVRGFNPGRGQWIFNGDKNPQHAFRRIGSKVVGPMSFSFTACLRSLRSLNKDTSLGQIRNFLRQFLLLYYYMTAGRIDREHWWTSHKFPPVDIIPPWFSMLTWGMNNRPVGGLRSET
jgi:hypothetical protein